MKMKINKTVNTQSTKKKFVIYNYTVIKFDDDDQGKMFECIPDLWFVNELRNSCFFPPKTGKAFMQRAINCEKPEDNWGIYECTVVKEGFLTYHAGFKLVKEKCLQRYNTSSAEEEQQYADFRRQHPGLIGGDIEHVFAKPQATVKESANDAVNSETNLNVMTVDKSADTTSKECITVADEIIENSRKQPKTSKKTTSRLQPKVPQKQSSRLESTAPNKQNKSQISGTNVNAKTSLPPIVDQLLCSSVQASFNSRSSRSSSNHSTARKPRSNSRSRSKRFSSNSRSPESNYSQNRVHRSRSHSSVQSSRRSVQSIRRSEQSSSRSVQFSRRSVESSRRSVESSRRSVESSRRSVESSRRSVESSRRSVQLSNGSRSSVQSSRASSRNRERSRSGRSRSRSRSGRNRSRSSGSNRLSSRSHSRLVQLRKNHSSSNRQRSIRSRPNVTRRHSRSSSRGQPSSFARRQSRIIYSGSGRSSLKQSNPSRTASLGSKISSSYNRPDNGKSTRQLVQNSSKEGRSQRIHNSTSPSNSAINHLIGSVNELTESVKKISDRLNQSDRRLSRLEVTINKIFITLGDINGNIRTPDEIDLDVEFNCPNLPIVSKDELYKTNRKLKDKEFRRLWLKQESNYCCPTKTSTDTKTITKYLKRFVSLSVRCKLTLKESGESGYTLHGDYNRVYLFLLDVMKEGYKMCGKKITVDEAHTALRVVWGRSKQLRNGEHKK